MIFNFAVTIALAKVEVLFEKSNAWGESFLKYIERTSCISSSFYDGTMFL
jgi:hypothetical protein